MELIFFAAPPPPKTKLKRFGGARTKIRSILNFVLGGKGVGRSQGKRNASSILSTLNVVLRGKGVGSAISPRSKVSLNLFRQPTEVGRITGSG